MKKINILHTEWSTGWGGQEMRILSESLALRDTYGAKVLLATRDGAVLGQKASEAGLEVAYFGFKNSLDIRSAYGIAKLAKKHEIDIINTHSGKDTWIGWMASILSGAKFVRTRHIGNKISSHPLNFVNKRADFIITTGEQIRQNFIDFNGILPSKIKSIPTGIDTRVFEPNKYDKNKVRDELGIPRSAVCVGNMGLFREVKRLDIFLNIALSIHKTHPNTHFLLVGSGDTESFVRDFISMNEMSEFVTLLPFSSEPAKMLSAMDIFMLTSSSEGVPQTLMQALFMQKACIATNVGSVRDLFFKDNFLLCDCDENQLKSALKLLLEHPQMLENLSSNKQEFVRTNFSLEKMASDVYSVYKEILGRKE